MPDYRKPTRHQEQQLERMRQLRQRAYTGKKDFLDRISTTAAKQTRDDLTEADSISNTIPDSVKEYEAYKYAGYKKGGAVMPKRMKKFDEGGDVEMPSTFERVGKSALEEGEEIFQKELAKRQEKTSTSPRRQVVDYGDETQRLMSRRTPMRDTGAVPVGAEEATPRMDARPQARQPSTVERMINALPAGAAGVAGAAALGRMASARQLAKNIEASKMAARTRSTDALKKATEARSAARSAAKEAEAGKDAARMAEEGGMRYGRGAPQPAKQDYRQAEAFLGRRRPEEGYKKGGNVKTYAKGGAVSASRRADGIAQRGKTKGRVY